MLFLSQKSRRLKWLHTMDKAIFILVTSQIAIAPHFNSKLHDWEPLSSPIYSFDSTWKRIVIYHSIPQQNLPAYEIEDLSPVVVTFQRMKNKECFKKTIYGCKNHIVAIEEKPTCNTCNLISSLVRINLGTFTPGLCGYFSTQFLLYFRSQKVC